MALILGTEYCKIDSNGRFKLPIALKRQLGTDDCRIAFRLGYSREYLELWTYDSIQAEIVELQKRLNPYNSHDREIKRQMMKASVMELDSNDRISIPSALKWVIGETTEIVLQGMGDCIELWNRSAYEKTNDEMEDFAAIVDKRLGEPYGVPPASDVK